MKKLGTKYDNVKRACDDGALTGTLKGWIGSNTCYDIYEEDVMTISAITIEVSGIILYQEGDLGITLNRLHKEWRLSDITRSNPRWGEMLQNTSCDIVE